MARLHAGTFRERAVDINNLVTLAHREVNRLLGLAMECLHPGKRGFTDIESALDDIPQLQQSHPEAVTPRLGSVDEALGYHVIQDAMGCRGV